MRYLIYILFSISIHAQSIELGYVTPESEGSLQKCFDSQYTCKLTKLTYDIDTTLIVRISKIIDGNNATLLLKNNVDVITLEKKIKPKEQLRGVKIYNLNINTTQVAHNKAAIRFNVNSRIMDVVLRNILITGKKETLYTEGMGTKALAIESENLSDYDPFLHNLILDNVKTEWCAEGLYIPHNGSLWVNVISGKLTTWGNKRSIFNEIADVIDLDLTMQFAAVLSEEEKDFSAITLKKYARNTNIIYMPFDTQLKEGDKYYKPKLQDINTTFTKSNGKTYKSRNNVKYKYVAQ
ncbi:MAG: hypothetical protein KDD23_10850 [Winogradskyella sp.]|nr:hypothetical protein [Winogradskyella sp.]